jgi:uncharacterized protein YqeY
MIKQRKESLVQFQAGNRQDWSTRKRRKSPAADLSAFPAERRRDRSLIADAIAATGAASIKDMGKVMGIIKAKAQGRADMAAVGAKIKAKLGG